MTDLVIQPTGWGMSELSLAGSLTLMLCLARFKVYGIKLRIGPDEDHGLQQR